MGKLVPPVTVELDKPRTLVCDMNAVQAIEDWTGVDLFGLIEKAGKNEDQDELVKTMKTPKVINAMLAAFMLHQDPTMTPKRAGQIVTTVSLLQVASEAVTEAFQRFFEVSVEATADPAAQTPAPASD